MSEEEKIESSQEDRKTESETPKAVEQPLTINNEPLTNMEVHHHPKVEKKNFKEYLLEGLMIFVAVFLGFIAESIRENISDNAKEKEYIYSMIEDAQTDTANIRQAIALNNDRIIHLDSLALLCASYSAAKNEDAEMYRHYRHGLIHPSFISPTERTIQQLKNAGGMRLIRKKAAVDSIVLYDDVAKKLADQQAYYELYQNKSVETGFQVFNFLRFGFGTAGANLRNFTDKDSSVKLLTTDKEKLMQFSNEISVYEGVVHFYNVRLQEMNDHAINLMNTLKKEYDIDDE